MKPSNTIRWTEACNPVTANIDLIQDGSFRENSGLVRLLSAADSGLFSSFSGLPSLIETETLLPLSNAVRLIATALYHPFGKVAFGGCGTSGRLSHLESRSLNALASACGLRNDCFTYLLAGGDAALVLSQEAAEDKPDAGKRDLEILIKEVRSKSVDAPIVVVGISCGLSATYVGSMLEYALNQPGDLISCVVIGFNPVEAVKDLRVEGWQSSFYTVLSQMLLPSMKHKAIVLNPSLGPEAIAGSSRMKGGSATKILVETLGLLSISLVKTSTSSSSSSSSSTSVSFTTIQQEDQLDTQSIISAAREIISGFQAAVNSVYSDTLEIETLISIASKSLTSPSSPSSSSSSSYEGFMSSTGYGRIIYLGIGSAGLIGLIDASECPPTYGSYFNDVRGFLGDGWSEVGIKSGEKIKTESGAPLVVPPHLRGDAGLASSIMSEPVELDIKSGFLNTAVLDSLGPCDTILIIGIDGDGTWLQNGDQESSSFFTALEALKAAKVRGCTVSHVSIGVKDECYSDIGAINSFKVVPTSSYLRMIQKIEEAITSISTIPDTINTHKRSGVQIVLRDTNSLDQRLGLPVGSCLLFFQQLSLKLVLNAITTGAHIRKGTVFGNRMVNVCLTNAKLFIRAVGIVKDVASCTTELAQESVIRSIYNVDRDSSNFAELLSKSILSHVIAASNQRGIVPVAIILAQSGGKDTIVETKELLRKQPVIRLAILESQKKRI
jgi:N-acetylmuramic acid 6-phosphate (MurNAc-6-P) etherase